MADNQCGIGIDIGGTKIVIALVSEVGKILDQKVFPTNPQQGANAIINHVVQEAEKLKSNASNQPKTIGIGVAGQILLDGTVKFAPNLGWREVPLKSLISDAVKMPVWVMNDVRAATWGEWKHGSGKGFDDILCLMIGTGIGGGAIIGGRLMTGANNGAGEVGHFPIELNGAKCTCGNTGCLETLASGWGIEKLAKQASLNASTARDVLKLAEQGDQISLGIIEKAIAAITAACIGYTNVFNPARLIIGGGLGLALPQLLERIESEIKARAFEAVSEKLKVVHSSLMQDAVAIGAAAFAIQTIMKTPTKGIYELPGLD
jgi:glucokinase